MQLFDLEAMKTKSKNTKGKGKGHGGRPTRSQAVNETSLAMMPQDSPEAFKRRAFAIEYQARQVALASELAGLMRAVSKNPFITVRMALERHPDLRLKIEKAGALLCEGFVAHGPAFLICLNDTLRSGEIPVSDTAFCRWVVEASFALAWEWLKEEGITRPPTRADLRDVLEARVKAYRFEGNERDAALIEKMLKQRNLNKYDATITYGEI